jgi:hypothetical protein
VIQSNYIPWKGYFDLIRNADLFVHYDEVQYTKNDWRNRNRIYSKNGLAWLTIPISRQAVHGPISAVELGSSDWQDLHFKTLQQAYGRARYFGQLLPLMEQGLLAQRWRRLIDVNRFWMKAVSELIGIRTAFVDSKDYVLQGSRVERLLGLLRTVGATEYITGPSARDYLSESELLFEQAGIRLTYWDYQGYPEYTQMRAPFEHYVSIVDLLANVELAEIPRHIWGWRKG